MGFSQSASTVILFSGLLLSVVILMSSTRSGYDTIYSSYDEMIDTDLAKLDTDIVVDHVYYNNSSKELALNIYADGEISIDCNNMDIVVDGEVITTNVIFRMNWVNYSNIFPKAEGILTVGINSSSIPYSSIPSSLRLGSIPFTPPKDTLWIAFWDAFYTLRQTATARTISRYHINGDLDWETDISGRFSDVISMMVDQEIYVANESAVKAFDLDGNFLRSYDTGGTTPDYRNLARANGRIYAANGTGGLGVYDVSTGDLVTNVLNNINHALDVAANSTGNIFVLDGTWEKVFEETFSGGVDANWLGDDGGEAGPSDEWWYVEEAPGDIPDIRVGDYHGAVGPNVLDLIDCDDDWSGQWAEARYNGDDNWFDVTEYLDGYINFTNCGDGMDNAGEGWRLEVTRNGGTSWVTVMTETGADANHGWQDYSYRLEDEDLKAAQFSFRFNSASSDAAEYSAFDDITFYVLESGEIDVFDSNNNHVNTIGNDIEKPVSLAITDYLEEDRIFVLEGGYGTVWTVKVYSFSGVLMDTMYISEIYPMNPGGYCTMDDGGALFLYSPDSRLVLELRMGYRMWIVTENGIKTLVIG